jgi:hypothetical protein
MLCKKQGSYCLENLVMNGLLPIASGNRGMIVNAKETGT